MQIKSVNLEIIKNEDIKINLKSIEKVGNQIVYNIVFQMTGLNYQI